MINESLPRSTNHAEDLTSYANATFEWIECWYNPHRRHSSVGMHSPVTFEALHTGSDQHH
jgi:transposase InsO family protein